MHTYNSLEVSLGLFDCRQENQHGETFDQSMWLAVYYKQPVGLITPSGVRVNGMDTHKGHGGMHKVAYYSSFI